MYDKGFNMDHQSSVIGYLIPLSLILGFLLFPVLTWLGKRDERKKNQKH